MERTKNLMSIQSNLTKENIKLVLVSLGTPMQAIKFIERTGFQGELLLLLLLLFLLFFVWLVIILWSYFVFFFLRHPHPAVISLLLLLHLCL